jgi:hypothetical protein
LEERVSKIKEKIQSVAEKVLTSPVGGVAAKVVLGPAALPAAGAAVVAKEVADALTKDPVIKNAINDEGYWRSRVGQSATVILIISGFNVYRKFKAKEFDEEFGTSLAIVIGAIYNLWGRFKEGLPPMWSRMEKLWSKE